MSTQDKTATSETQQEAADIAASDLEKLAKKLRSGEIQLLQVDMSNSLVRIKSIRDEFTGKEWANWTQSGLHGYTIVFKGDW